MKNETQIKFDRSNFCTVRIGGGVKLHIAYIGTNGSYYPRCGLDNCASLARKTDYTLEQVTCGGCRKFAIKNGLISA